MTGTQTDGVVSPSGSYANAFLSYHEKEWLIQSLDELKLSLYDRYVNGTFLLGTHEEVLP